MKEDALALADDVESTIGGCYGCLLDKRGLCKAETDFDCNDEVCKFVAHRLRAIAEKDAENVTTVSAYDLLPGEDRKAIAWVCEHGGLEAVEKRLMPEGMEWLVEAWPRFEDDKPVRPGDKLLDKDGDWFEAVSFVFTRDWWSVRGYQTEGFGDLNDKTRRTLEGMSYGARVKRPTPKVLDADGVEIHEGDEVWTDYGDGPWTVTKITTAHAWHVYGHSAELGSLDMQPNLLTHRAPVLAADGKPLKEGDKVWSTAGEFDGERTVKDVCKDPDEQSYATFEERGEPWSCLCCLLTHERPDTWERLEHDAEKTVCEYFGANYGCANCPLESARCAEEVKKDIIRRAKKLAEREQ